METKLTAADLRVGNRIYFPFHKEVVEVVGLPILKNGKQGIQVITKGTILCEELREQFVPIPLSEERLFKVGFVNSFKQYKLLNRGLKVLKDVHSANTWIVFQGFLNQFNEITCIEYLHELQNIWKDLTKTELTIKEDNQ